MGAIFIKAPELKKILIDNNQDQINSLLKPWVVYFEAPNAQDSATGHVYLELLEDLLNTDRYRGCTLTYFAADQLFGLMLVGQTDAGLTICTMVLNPDKTIMHNPEYKKTALYLFADVLQEALVKHLDISADLITDDSIRFFGRQNCSMYTRDNTPLTMEAALSHLKSGRIVKLLITSTQVQELQINIAKLL